MKKTDWKYINRIQPLPNKLVIAFGTSCHDGKKKTVCIGYMYQKDDVWFLGNDHQGIEGLRDVLYWQYIVKPV